MDQLVIKLTGEIQSSNFDEWKTDLIVKIQSVNRMLTTDDDFVEAIEHVKSFKEAEKFLKEAKQSALEQAADIQSLFAAIDEVSEEARQARLSLDRQIKARKIEIKERLIQSGIEVIRSIIEQQGDDFQQMDHTNFLDRSRFDSATKGKASIKGLQSAIDDLCSRIKEEISQRAQDVRHNKIAIDSLDDKYKMLFQDRTSLLPLTKQELELTIENRIAKYKEDHATIKAKKVINILEKIDHIELNPEKEDTLEEFKIIIEVFSSKNMAMEIARSIREKYGENESIKDVRLVRNHD